MSIPAGPTSDAFSSTIDASNPFTSSDMPPPLFPCCVPALPLAFPAAASLPHSSLAESWNPPLVSELEGCVEKRRSLLSCNVRRRHASLQRQMPRASGKHDAWLVDITRIQARNLVLFSMA